MMQSPKQGVQAVTQPSHQGLYMPNPYSLPQSPCNSPGPQSIAMVACCAIYGENHASQSCQLLDPSGQGSSSNMEQVDAIGYTRPQCQGFQSYGQQPRNQYGTSWNNQGRNLTPGFQGNQGNRSGNQGNQSWRGNQNQGQWNNQSGQGYGNNQNHQGISQATQDPNMKTSMSMIMNQMSKLQTEVEGLRAQQQGGGTQGSNQASSSSGGKLPANTENSRNHVNAITTRSGKALKDPPYPGPFQSKWGPEVEKNESDQGKGEVEVENILESNNEEEHLIQRDKAKENAPIDCGDQRRLGERTSSEISMPFVDAVTQIPSYKKFLKDILILQHKLPPKLKDLGSFTILCIIGGFVVGSVLCDLGANVSLMPYSLCKRLNLGEPKPTTMTLHMADRSVKHPVGVLEDIPVMIDQYFIPGDFVILDIEEDTKVPIILGRPFLATARAIIDVKRGKLVMEVTEHKIEFDIFKMAKH
ncbi:uncharacterized protein LOC115995968 [Ipomoea triloba]|uniref:uncharacterized protein LOC115995968 n=1 Tax=Ipomoea triloba TaxID=35885 RepID=UPI00125E4E8E|nr:uncharacterized protein LOC115995968 [Ipomoea triloba]